LRGLPTTLCRRRGGRPVKGMAASGRRGRGRACTDASCLTLRSTGTRQ
jgi:hypothetical protein